MKVLVASNEYLVSSGKLRVNKIGYRLNTLRFFAVLAAWRETR